MMYYLQLVISSLQTLSYHVVPYLKVYMFLLHILRHKLEARVILPHEDVSRMNRINCMREILKHNNITTWIVFKIRDAIFSYFIQATRNVRFLALMLQSFINCICTLKYMFSCNFFWEKFNFSLNYLTDSMLEKIFF